MKTKFTKGKWELITLRGEVIGVATEKNIEGNVICEMPTLNQSLKNWDANALLISKAPEMFEMLLKIMLMTENFNGTFEDFRDRYNSEIEQLLKEATEL